MEPVSDLERAHALSSAAKMCRRSALGAGAGAVVAALTGRSALGAAAEPFFQRVNLDVGLELYTVKEELKADLDGTLARIAKIGFRHVELAGFDGYSPTQLRAALDRHGLACRSFHVAAQSSGRAEFPNLMDTPQVVECAGTLGAKHVILVMVPLPQQKFDGADNLDMGAFLRAVSSLNAEDWESCAALLNSKGRELQGHGLKLGYHNHNIEFSKLANTTPFEILMTRTDPKIVTFEIDAGWVAAAGIDPVTVLKRYPGRFELMHVKDLKATTKANYTFAMDPADIGAGSLDWPKILPAAYEAGVRNFLIEQEPPFPPAGATVSTGNGYRYLVQLTI